ncbi:hypothetical protein ACHQM5_018947 [Ranunculus cassubicifolius]
MSPSQVSTPPRPEIAVKSLVRREDDMSLRCVSNCQDTTFDMEALLDHNNNKGKELVGGGEMEVDVVGCIDDGKNGGEFRVGQQGDETDDESEGSSSFGNTCSGGDDDERLSDNEVDSLYGEANLFDGFDCLFRTGKKKATSQWRRHVNPLTWRGKWTELRLKEMKAQLLKYDKELASYAQREPQFELGQCTPDDFNVKSLPFAGQGNKKEIMKRRKREKVEDMVDISSYMSHHNLFSFHENKKNDLDCALVDEESSNPVIELKPEEEEKFNMNDTSFEIRDDTLEHVLWKIELVHSRMQKLRIEIDKLVTEHAAKFASYESLTELVESENDQTAPSRSPPPPPAAAVPPVIAERVPGVVLDVPPPVVPDHPESVVPSYVEAVPQPDIIEVSVVPSSKEVRLDQSYFIDSQNSQEVKAEPYELPGPSTSNRMATVKEENVTTDYPPIASTSKSENKEPNRIRENSALKSSLPSEIYGPPTTKRKRGERKPGAGTWNADPMVAQIPS